MKMKKKTHSRAVWKTSRALCILLCAVLAMPPLAIQARSDLSRYNAKDHIGPFHEGMAAVWTEDGYGFIDKNGNEVIAPAYGDVSSPYFSDGLALVGKDGKYGYIDKTGKEVIKLQYDNYGYGPHGPEFSDGLALMGKNGKYIYVNKKGKEVIQADYDTASGFSQGLALVCRLVLPRRHGGCKPEREIRLYRQKREGSHQAKV